MPHDYDENCQCSDCIDARIDSEHDGALEQAKNASKLEERRRKERIDRIRERRKSRDDGMAREADPTAPSVEDLGAMFKLD